MGGCANEGAAAERVQKKKVLLCTAWPPGASRILQANKKPAASWGRGNTKDLRLEPALPLAGAPGSACKG